MPAKNKAVRCAGIAGFLADEVDGWRFGELLWLVFCLLSITALSLSCQEKLPGVLAAVTGMMYTILAGKGKISCYFFGLINAPLYAYLSWVHGYYGDMVLNVYYFLMMFPGLWVWSRNRCPEPGKGVVKSRLKARERIVWGCGIVLVALALWPVLSAAGGSRPLCDAFTNVLSVGAMVLTVKRCIEQWVLWIIVDVIEVFMWWKVHQGGGGVAVLLMWLLFLVNGIYLLRLWMRNLRYSSASSA